MKGDKEREGYTQKASMGLRMLGEVALGGITDHHICPYDPL